MVIALLPLLPSLLGAALAAGISLDTAWVSSHGPDSYGRAHLQASSGDLEIGALGFGGTQPALAGTVARGMKPADPLRLRAELRLGMLREGGPTAGFALGGRLDLGDVTVALDLDQLAGVGIRASGGVNIDSGRFEVRPRLLTETWAGDRDPALRVELGLHRRLRPIRGGPGAQIGLALSGGGRDVLHMGPGLALHLSSAPLSSNPSSTLSSRSVE